VARLPNIQAFVIPNGVEVPVAAYHESGHGTLRILYLGRLHPIKGIENLIGACEILALSDALAWSLTLAGSGKQEYVRTLQARLEKGPLIGRVHFVGQADPDAKRQLFAHSDLLVLPSHTENFGIVAAEALAHAVPVIASKGSPWQSLESVGCGLWVDNDPESLAEAIRRIAHFPLSEMGARGRAWMQRDFSWPSIAAQMLVCYRELIGSSGVNERE
jgi:glycosyltransferase involved in cell wall biosynthesis